MKERTVILMLMECNRTERAILVAETDEPEVDQHWLPLSQIEVQEKENSIIEVEMPEWLAQENGLI